MEGGTFEWYDYAVFAATLALSLAIGLYFALAGGGQRTVAEYLVANRKMTAGPVGASITMSIISAIIVLGTTAEVYVHGGQRAICMPFSFVGITIACYWFVPLFYRLRLTSLHEYFQMRYNSRLVEVIGAVVTLVRQTFYIGLALYAPSTALEGVTGIAYWKTALAAGTVGIVYTTIGGMKTVVWTDTVQGVIMVGGLIVILIVGEVRMGSRAILSSARDMGRFNLIVWDPNPFQRLNLWSIMSGSIVLGFIVGTMQTSLQRFCATPTLNQARLSVMYSAFGWMLVEVLTIGIGYHVFAFYDILGCDPLRTGQVTSANQLLPYYITEGLRIPCFPGLLMSVVFSGALSTVSSSMSANATVTWKHFLEARFQHLTESRRTLVTKLLAVSYGLLGLGFAVASEYISGNVLQIAGVLVYGVAAPVTGMLIMGAIFSFTNWKGAAAGALLGFCIQIPCCVGNAMVKPYPYHLNSTVTNCSSFNLTYMDMPRNEDVDDIFPLFRLSFFLYSVLSLTVTIVTGVIVSLLTGGDEVGVNRRGIIVPGCLGNCRVTRRDGMNSSPDDEEKSQFTPLTHAPKLPQGVRGGNSNEEKPTRPSEETHTFLR